MLNWGVRIALRVRVKLYGRENMINGPAVIIMNHQSNFDPLLHGPAFPINTVIIGKKELLKIPFWGRLFKSTNNILVDRKKKDTVSKGAPHKAIRNDKGGGTEEAILRLNEDDCYIWIFPEGTRSHGNALGKFKSGAFVIAIEAQVPIIPIISKPLHQVLDIPNKIAPGGQHEIKILPAISTAGTTIDLLPQLIKDCEKLYKTELEKYAKVE